MVGFVQTTMGKLQYGHDWLAKRLPAEINVRNILIFSVLSLLCLGSVMVGSASMPYAEDELGNSLHFVTRHGISVLAASLLALAAYRVPLEMWFKNAMLLWVGTITLLGLVLVVGTEVNGSTRWLRVAGFTLQATEVAKLTMAIFTADYVVRRAQEIRSKIMGLIRLGIIMLLTVGFIIAEPDLGATVVIVMMMLGIFFLAGAPVIQFGFAFGAILIAFAFLIIFEPYRFERLMSFMDPWEDPLGTGYQLSNALMAFGRGEFFGVGIGHSMQKMSFLPEAHTDFMLAILGEEFGFFGISMVLLLSFTMLICCVKIGHRALANQYLRAGYLAYGISIIFLLQILVNAGMNMGLLPTKGLTLPFISYGGSSLIMCAVMISLVLKIEANTKLANPRREESSF